MVPVGDSSTALTEAPGLLIPPYAAEWISVQTQGQHKLQIKALFFPLCLSNSFFWVCFSAKDKKLAKELTQGRMEPQKVSKINRVAPYLAMEELQCWITPEEHLP